MRCPIAVSAGLFLLSVARAQQVPAFDPFDATIPDIRAALSSHKITCRQLVQYYFSRMEALDSGGPKLNAIRARNPKALEIAEAYDKVTGAAWNRPLFCIPIALKDNIDNLGMPTTAGSIALENTYASDDAFVTKQLKAAGAIIIAKANLTEFANYLTAGMPTGYSSLGGYTLNPYDPRPIPAGLQNSDGRPALGPGGSSSGPAVVSAANLAAAAVGTETSGSILSPASANSVVGIKPTVGLISRSGIVPIAASQDTAGPITRSVTDAAILLGAMTGVDGRDSATISSIGRALTDYTPFLKADAFAGARIGIPRQYWNTRSPEERALGERAFDVMRRLGAEVFDVEIASFTELSASSSSVLAYEFKRDLNTYLANRGPGAAIKTLTDVIAFNKAHREAGLKYGQTLAITSDAMDLYAAGPKYVADRANDLRLAKVEGIDATMNKNGLTALVMPANGGASIAAKSGYPSVIVPGGYLSNSSPFGITFTGKAYSEPTLIGIAYAFEQATKYREAPGSALRVLPVSSAIRPVDVLNYADGSRGAIAPGETVAITGTGLGPDRSTGPTIKPNRQIDTGAGGTRVLFDGIPAPILGAQANQVIAIVPYGVAGRQSVQMHVEIGGRRSTAVSVPVADAAPGIFTDQRKGNGTPVILNSDGTLNSATNPAEKGSVIAFFATGEGVLNTLAVDGRLPAAPLQTPQLPVVVRINNGGVDVSDARAVPGIPGQMQVNAVIHPGSASGSLPLVLGVGERYSRSVPVHVQ